MQGWPEGETERRIRILRREATNVTPGAGARITIGCSRWTARLSPFSPLACARPWLALLSYEINPYQLRVYHHPSPPALLLSSSSPPSPSPQQPHQGAMPWLLSLFFLLYPPPSPPPPHQPHPVAVTFSFSSSLSSSSSSQAAKGERILSSSRGLY